jgi:thiol-disulfide isomerase/thioredoxin
LGALTLLVIAIVVGGVLLFGGDDQGAAVSVPDLTESLGLTTQNGEVAADFAIDLMDGTGFRLSDHLAVDGRPVILNLWASWCGPGAHRRVLPRGRRRGRACGGERVRR